MKPRIEYVYATALIVSVLQIFIFFTNLECEVDGWGKDVLRNISLYVTEGSTQILPLNFCLKPSFLLIVVSSAPSNLNARQAIRDTWGSQKSVFGKSINLVFFIGNSLEPSMQDTILIEGEQYQDIIQEDFTDSYYNLTLKSVLMLKVSSEKCMGKAKFLLKTDDDMFVNIPRLIKLLIERNDFENVLLGRMMCGTKPIKDPTSKWYCPNYMYNNTFFPNFLSGTGYVMSIDVTKKLYNAALAIPLIHLEDVYITGICAEKIGIIPKFNMDFTANTQVNEFCQLKDLITIHYFLPERMRYTYHALNEPQLEEKCSHYEPMFKAWKWMKQTLFMPISRLKRERIC